MAAVTRRAIIVASASGAVMMAASGAVMLNAMAGSCSSSSSSAPSPAPLPVNGDYAFEDDFNGEAGAAPDTSKWSYITGNGATVSGNNESEVYTDNVANAYLDGESHLVLAVTSPSPGIFNSARIDTKGKFSQLYGSWQARIAIENVPGCWPAFWFLGADGKWPACGEIDVMENFGTGISTGTIWSATAASQRHAKSSAAIDSDFHTYQLDIAKDQIALYRDKCQFLTATPGNLSPWPFNDNGGMYALLDVATGGTGTGYVNPSPAVLPARMVVDYVRAW